MAFDIATCFKEVSSSTELSPPVAAIAALTDYTSRCDGMFELKLASTMTEFTLQLQEVTKLLLEDQRGAISVFAGCELFIRFVSRLASEDIVTSSFI